MSKLFMVALGGAIGASARYWLGNLINSCLPMQFPLGTFVIHVTGSFIIGFFLTLIAQRITVHPNWRLLIAVGFVGAYSSFRPSFDVIHSKNQDGHSERDPDPESQAAQNARTSQSALIFLSPIGALNHAIAVTQNEGPERGIEEIRSIADRDRLVKYPFYSAALGELEFRCGRRQIACEHFLAARSLARTPTERQFLDQRISVCEAEET